MLSKKFKETVQLFDDKLDKNGDEFPPRFQDIGQQSHRRKWDKDEYERKARDREDEEAEARGEVVKKKRDDRDDKNKKGTQPFDSCIRDQVSS